LNAASLAIRPFTIVRTRLAISFLSDQVASSEFTQAVLGMQVVTEAAATAGIASIPTPITEVNADFFVYKPMFSQILFATGVGFQESVGDAAMYVVDSKAMRKVGIDDDVAQTLEVRQGATLGVDIAIEGRFLIKLH